MAKVPQYAEEAEVRPYQRPTRPSVTKIVWEVGQELLAYGNGLSVSLLRCVDPPGTFQLRAESRVDR